MILATRFSFIVERSWKNMYFHANMAWPRATYDVICRIHSNWPSLNLSQNVHERWANSYWKRQVLMFYPLVGRFLENSFKSINVVTFLSRVIRNLGHGLLVLSIQFQTTGPLNRRLFVPNFSRYFHQRPVASWVHDFYMLRQPIYHVFFLKHINN